MKDWEKISNQMYYNEKEDAFIGTNKQVTNKYLNKVLKAKRKERNGIL